MIRILLAFVLFLSSFCCFSQINRTVTEALVKSSYASDFIPPYSISAVVLLGYHDTNDIMIVFETGIKNLYSALSDVTYGTNNEGDYSEVKAVDKDGDILFIQVYESSILLLYMDTGMVIIYR